MTLIFINAAYLLYVTSMIDMKADYKLSLVNIFEWVRIDITVFGGKQNQTGD